MARWELKIPMRPGGRIIGRINGRHLRDRAFPKNCQLVGREDGSCRTHEGLRAIASRTSNMPIRLAPMIGSGRLFDTRFGRCAQIRRIEIIFTGDSKPA